MSEIAIMVKHTTVVLVLLVVYVHTWLPLGTSFVSVFATPATEEAHPILSSLSEARRQRARAISYPYNFREELGDYYYYPRIGEENGDDFDEEYDDELYYPDGGDREKRKAHASKWRLRGSKRSFNDEKRRLRFIKRNYLNDQETALAPRLRFRDGNNHEQQ